MNISIKVLLVTIIYLLGLVIVHTNADHKRAGIQVRTHPIFEEEDAANAVLRGNNRAYNFDRALTVERLANIQWDNTGDGPLSVECNTENGEAIVRVKSEFIGWRRDRRWKWDCRKVAEKPMTDCSWTPFINNFQGRIDKKCPANFVLTGVKSHHLNAKEDRRWKLKCCRAQGYITTKCKKSHKINEYHKKMDYEAPKQTAIVGLHSVHHNGRDREWNLFQCKYSAKPDPTTPPPPQGSNVKTRHFIYVPYDMVSNYLPSIPWPWYPYQANK